MVFKLGTFVLHSGETSRIKIECDDLTDDDIEAIAYMGAKTLEPRGFGSVLGIPRGGLRFAKAMEKYVTEGPLLICDDVYTTGASMREARQSPKDIGLVMFARAAPEDWIDAVFLSYAVEL